MKVPLANQRVRRNLQVQNEFQDDDAPPLALEDYVPPAILDAWDVEEDEDLANDIRLVAALAAEEQVVVE